MRRLRLLPLLCLAPALAAARPAPEGFVVHYACSGGATISAAYVNPPGGASYAVVVFDGRMTPMKAGPTGSGVRYLSLDRWKLVWHVKGDQGFLAHDDADETMIAPGCTASRS
ncbi:MAG: MliC family protein [Amaricoccus sp.]